MQKNFIEELESRAAENIKKKESEISELLVEENNHMGANEEIVEELHDFNKDLENHSGATDKLRKLGQLKG